MTDIREKAGDVVGFKATLIGAILVSGAIGGGLAYLRGTGQVGSVGDVAADAGRLFRTTMRKFDSKVYVRGPDYGACVADYGRNAPARTNSEITFACECFDKGMRMLGSADRQSALDALRPSLPGAKPAPGADIAGIQASVAAVKLLNRCDIKPVAPAGFLSMRGTM
ncbi:MAG: hypothetical protein WAU86_20800 [Oricola sp.]